MSELNHEPYWVPTYPTGTYGGTDPTRRSRKRKNPIGFAPPKETTMTPYRERQQAGEYEDKPPAKPKTTPKKTTTKKTTKQ